MPYIDPIATVTGVLYFFGIILHYVHVCTIFHLLDRRDEQNMKRTLLLSLVWPVTSVQIIWEYIFGEDQDDYEED